MTLRALVCLGVLAAACSPALGQKRPPPDPAGKVFAGGYELSTLDGARKCLILLGAPAGAGKGRVGFPPPCRRTLPALGAVTVWAAEATGAAARPRIMLSGATGVVRLDFAESDGDGGLRGVDEAGQAYRLKPMAGPTPEARAAVVAGEVAERARASAPASAPHDPAAMARAAGAYAMVRPGGDSGCVLMLAGGSASEGAAQLTPGCGDKGIVFFAPTGWRIAGGTLWLTSTRGKLSFERNRKGGWDKGPGQGETLSLIRR